jgi:hypothetical protein
MLTLWQDRDSREAMSNEIVDPVVGYRLVLETEGENLIINTWVRPGGGAGGTRRHQARL